MPETFRAVRELFESSVDDPELAQAWASAHGTDLRGAWSDCPRAGWLLRLAAAGAVDPKLYVRAGLWSARWACDLAPGALEPVEDALAMLGSWCEGLTSEADARAAMEHAGMEASRIAGLQSDPPGPERDEQRSRSLAMRAVGRAAETALGRIPSRYVWPTAADLARSVARMRAVDLDEHERRSTKAIRGIIPVEALCMGAPRPPVVVAQPCYVELRITDPERWRSLAALWKEVGRRKAEDGLDPDDERWATMAPEGRLQDVCDALYSIASAEYEVLSAIELEPGIGRLRFDPWAHPYGGVEPIEWLVHAFGGWVVAMDDGTGRRELG